MRTKIVLCACVLSCCALGGCKTGFEIEGFSASDQQSIADAGNAAGSIGSTVAGPVGGLIGKYGGEAIMAALIAFGAIQTGRHKGWDEREKAAPAKVSG